MSAPLSTASCATPARTSSTRPGKRARAEGGRRGVGQCDRAGPPSRSASPHDGVGVAARGESADAQDPDATSQTWIAWRPIEPVLPRSATLRMFRRVGEETSSRQRLAEQRDDGERGRAREEQRVDAVEHAAVARRAACPSP